MTPAEIHLNCIRDLEQQIKTITRVQSHDEAAAARMTEAKEADRA